MMNNILTKMIFGFINYLFCTSGDDIHVLGTVESQKIIHEPLYFSFKEKIYNNFRCNFTNEICFSQTPTFDQSKPVRNFFLVFCLFFQHSLITNDKEFKNIIEDMYKNYHKKMHIFRQEAGEFVYNQQNFIDYLNKLDSTVKNILKRNETGLVFVEEKNERIFITVNEKSSDFDLMSVFSFADDIYASENEEIVKAIIEFYTKLCEVYLQGLLEQGFFESLNIIHYEYRTRMRNKDFVESSNEQFEELLKLYIRLNNSVKEEYEKVSVNDKKKKFIDDYEKYFTKFARMYVTDKFSLCLEELLSSIANKCPSKDSYDIFLLNLDEYKNSLLKLMKIVKKKLQDLNIINVDDQRSFLVKMFMEYAVLSVK